MNRRPHLDLIAVAIIAIVCTGAGLATELDPFFRRSAAVLFTVVLPGYAITAALYPRATIGALERLTLTLSISLAVATLGAVVLNATPRGIHSDSWALMLGGVTLAATAIAMYRRPPLVDVWAPTWPRSVEETRGPAILLVLALIVSAGALVIAGQGAAGQSQPNFTQLWLLPTDDDDMVEVGVRNAEVDPLVMRLVVESGDTVLGEWRGTEVLPGQTFEQQIDIGDVSSRDPIVATVYLENTPSEPFRQARLFPE